MARYLVTSALPYANGPIHFGHVAGAYLPADVWVRHRRMCGDDVLFVCGTDEHGVAITLQAEREGVGYREYVDRWHQEIGCTFERFGIRFDAWSGTARSPHHVEFSQRFFRVLLERGFVFEREEEQWFSEASGRFLPDRYLQGACPECGHPEARGDECPKCGAWIEARKLGDPISLVDGSRPVLKRTKHWYLDLPKLLDAGLRDWYEERKAAGAWKPNVVGYVDAMLADLKPRPITRDLPWGVPVPPELPGSEGKVLYVWFDAPIGYVSITEEWAQAQGAPESWRDWWMDADTRLVHFIGKDNIAFHVVVFPGMLLGQDADPTWQPASQAPIEPRSFVLPWNVPANEFYNLQGRKFSTSQGWTLDMDRFFERYSVDAARFHLVLTMPETADSEFRWEEFQTTNNSLLADKIGNFASRVLQFARKRYSGRVPGPATRQPLLADHEALRDARAAFARVGDELDAFRFRAAARGLVQGFADLNRFFDAMEPWKLVKSEADDDRARCAEVVERCLAHLELGSRRLAPFCPDAAARLRAMLGEAARPEDAGRWGGEGPDQPPTRLPEGAELGEVGILFRKIEDAEVEEEVRLLHERAGELRA